MDKLKHGLYVLLRAVIAILSWIVVFFLIYRGICYVIKDMRTRTRPDSDIVVEETTPVFNYKHNIYTIYYYTADGSYYEYDDCKDITIYDNSTLSFNTYGTLRVLNGNWEIQANTKDEAVKLDSSDSSLY
jgi:hypothetical protein